MNTPLKVIQIDYLNANWIGSNRSAIQNFATKRAIHKISQFLRSTNKFIQRSNHNNPFKQQVS